MKIAVCNLKGGVAKTTTTYYLKNILSGKKLLLDVTSENTLTNLVTGDLQDRNLISYLAGEHDWISVLQEINPELFFVPGTEKMGDLEKSLAGNNKPELVLHNKLRRIMAEYDNVIMDCPPALSIILRATLIIADTVIIPVTPDRIAIRDAKSIIANIEALQNSQKYGKQTGNKNIFILPTMFKKLDRRDREDLKTIRSELSDFRILPAIPYDNGIRDSIRDRKIKKSKGLIKYREMVTWLQEQ